MSQLPPANPIEDIRNSKRELEETYEQVHHHFETLYPLPKKFIEQTAPLVDNYLKKFSKPGANDDLFVFQALMGFLTQFDDFALMANQVFSDYNEQAKACKSYIEKISDIEKSSAESISADSVQQYAELAPTVTDIRQQLSAVKSRSDDMLKKLETIETRWNKIKTRIKP